MVYFTIRLINHRVKYRLMPPEITEDTLSLIFNALADPTRRAILARLAQGEATVKELAEPFAGTMSLPAISKHLKVLERAGFITRGRDAQWRPCRLDPGPMQEVARWVDQYRQLWEHRLNRLDDYLRELQAQQLQPAADVTPDPATPSDGSTDQ